MQTTEPVRQPSPRRELAGLDDLDLPLRPPQGPPPAHLELDLAELLAAIGLALLLWQIVVWLGLRPAYVLPGPLTVLPALFKDLTSDDRLVMAIATTMRRAVVGFGFALVIGDADRAGGDPVQAAADRGRRR